MRKITVLVLCLMFILSGCSNSNKNNSSINSSSDNVSGKIYNNKKLNPLDLNGLTYQQICESLGKQHSEPISGEGSLGITYNQIYWIHFEAMEASLSASDKVVAIDFCMPYDVYKGISVGKSLKEINENSNLLNKLVAEPYQDDGYFDCVVFEYKGKQIGMYVMFDNKYVCKSIDMYFSKEQSELSTFRKI